jgi:hypothetical protein
MKRTYHPVHAMIPTTLCVIPIHDMILLDIPPKVIEALDGV